MPASPSSRRAWIEIFEEILENKAAFVALLAEGVDRNTLRRCGVCIRGGSPSSRRAWIEISAVRSRPAARASPSSRRAWIEIDIAREFMRSKDVALLAEGVDRNFNLQIIPIQDDPGRPPRGGRG